MQPCESIVVHKRNYLIVSLDIACERIKSRACNWNKRAWAWQKRARTAWCDASWPGNGGTCLSDPTAARETRSVTSEDNGCAFKRILGRIRTLRMRSFPLC